jgi:hypothetical protein
MGLATRIFAGDNRHRTIPYRAPLGRELGSIAAAILLQQVVYWWNTSGEQQFYKFKEPCAHRLCREGDSWVEELGMSRREFDTARGIIAYKHGEDDEGKPVRYWVDGDRVTHYAINEPNLRDLLTRVYSPLTHAEGEPEVPAEDPAPTPPPPPADLSQYTAETLLSLTEELNERIKSGKAETSPVRDTPKLTAESADRGKTLTAESAVSPPDLTAESAYTRSESTGHRVATTIDSDSLNWEENETEIELPRLHAHRRSSTPSRILVRSKDPYSVNCEVCGERLPWGSKTKRRKMVGRQCPECRTVHIVHVDPEDALPFTYGDPQTWSAIWTVEIEDAPSGFAKVSADSNDMLSLMDLWIRNEDTVREAMAWLVEQDWFDDLLDGMEIARLLSTVDTFMKRRNKT